MNNLLYVSPLPDALIFFGGAFATVIVALIMWAIVGKIEKPVPKAGLHFVVVFNHLKITTTRMEFKNTQFVEGTVAATDAKGDAAQIQAGSVQASSGPRPAASL